VKALCQGENPVFPGGNAVAEGLRGRARAALRNGCRTGERDEFLVDENPLANFKLLYGTGHRRLNRATGAMERVGGVRCTLRDGIVFDARLLLADVRALVAEQRELEARQNIE
jgi:hypothetical protein